MTTVRALHDTTDAEGRVVVRAGQVGEVLRIIHQDPYPTDALVDYGDGVILQEPAEDVEPIAEGPFSIGYVPGQTPYDLDEYERLKEMMR